MLSRFEQELAVRSPTLDGHFGELTRIEPQAAGEFVVAGADLQRPAYEVVGTFRPRAEVMSIRNPKGGAAADNVSVSTALDQFSFLKSVLGNPARWPRAGDHIVRKDKPGMPRFKVSRAFADGLVRLTCIVVPLQ